MTFLLYNLTVTFGVWVACWGTFAILGIAARIIKSAVSYGTCDD